LSSGFKAAVFAAPNALLRIPITEATLVEPQVVANQILSTPNLDGLTVSGGEPMLQSAALLELFMLLKQRRDLSIICFTGFTLSQLQAKCDRNIDTILQTIDVLIDGQYVQALNDDQGWRGSSNQVVHFLSSRHRAESHMFLERRRNVEIYFQHDATLLVGIPPQQVHTAFDQTMKNLAFRDKPQL
jgi:anaerobic ribonucleoside-triphosphate reductase activating protein